MQTKTITLDDPDTGETYSYSVEEWLQCEHCGYTWDSTSDLSRPTCPSCSRKTDRITTLRYHFFSKQSCWISETLTADQLYEMASEYVAKAGIEMDADELQLLMDGAGNFAITTDDSDEHVAVDFTYNGFKSADDSVNEHTLSPVEEVSTEDDRWPTRPPQDVAPYTQSMRNWARKLEVLEEHGWTMADADGEHLYFEKDVEVEEENPHEVTDTLE